MDNETIIAVANATEATATATTKALETADKLGAFLAPYVKGPLTRISGYVEQRIGIWCDGNLLALRTKFEQQLLANGIVPLRELPLGFAIDVLEHGAMEEDGSLQDLWARLLANAADATTGVEARRSYVSVLADFTPLDALVFDCIYAFDPAPRPEQSVFTFHLPERATLVEKISQVSHQPPSDAVRASLANLSRLGLLIFEHTMDGHELHAFVNQTFAGEQLKRATARR